jgi:hypothetical protein
MQSKSTDATRAEYSGVYARNVRSAAPIASVRFVIVGVAAELYPRRALDADDAPRFPANLLQAAVARHRARFVGRRRVGLRSVVLVLVVALDLLCAGAPFLSAHDLTRVGDHRASNLNRTGRRSRCAR